jgi:hypothetical protein
MEDAAYWLLIIVSSTLTVFLILLIIALIYFIKLLGSLRRISTKAENVAESVEAAAETFERSAKPMAVLKLVSNIADSVAKFRKKER